MSAATDCPACPACGLPSGRREVARPASGEEGEAMTIDDLVRVFGGGFCHGERRGDCGKLWQWVEPSGEDHDAGPLTRDTAESLVRRFGGRVRRITPLWQRASEARR